MVKLYISNGSGGNKKIHEFALSTAYDVSSLPTPTSTVISGQDATLEVLLLILMELKCFYWEILTILFMNILYQPLLIPQQFHTQVEV